MGSHKHKRKYESNSSSSESDSSSSSNHSKSKGKKYLKKSKRSSSEESNHDKTVKSKLRRHSDDSDSEKTKKTKKTGHELEERSSDHKHRERDHRSERYKEDKYEERYKDKYKSVDTDRFKDKGKPRDKETDLSRNRRDYDRERYEDKDRNKRQDYRRDDRRSFRYQGNSREHRDNEGDYRSRDRGDNRDNNRRNNNRHGNRERSNSFDHTNAKWGKSEPQEKEKEKEKEKPNFGLSGKLTEETNTFKGVVIKYSEPPEARKPRRRWRLYPFKGEKALQTLYIHRESAYLIGRERKVVDLPVDHPSCSKQHAALQYRLVPFTREDGSSGKRVRPYLIDLESANGTFINNKKIESKKYVELFEKDVIKFGFSSREYVLLHENSKDEAMDDDVKQEEEEIPIKKEEPE